MVVLILQFAEGLSDRQAADAVRARIDWKYLLCLELTVERPCEQSLAGHVVRVATCILAHTLCFFMA